MSVYQDTITQLKALAQRSPQILVAYSGGKDSLVVMDLCAKLFKQVGAFYFYTVPGLEVIDKWMRFAKTRWNIEPVQLPHFRRLAAMKNGLWCDVVQAFDRIPEFGLREAYAFAMDQTGIGMMATGMKNADGLPRRQFFANIRDGGDDLWARVHHPLKFWRKKDILDYLTVHSIPIPDSNKGAVTSGVGLDHDSLCWLHDSYPEDFKKLLKWFPYADSVIKRREWFNVGA